jgi:hypothetical protein
MATLVYTHQNTELLRCNSATRYPDVGDAITINGTEYKVAAVFSVKLGIATVIVRLPGTYYYAHGRYIATSDDEPLLWHGDRTTINGIHYHVVGRGPGRIDLELYTFPTTLTGYLLMLHSMTEAQYNQWFDSLSYAQLCTYTDKWHKGDTRAWQLEAYQCAVDCGTIVYYHNERWEAYNPDYLASVTASTLAELVNSWAEATDHVSYE